MDKPSYLGLCRGYGKTHFAFLVVASGSFEVCVTSKHNHSIPFEVHSFPDGTLGDWSQKVFCVSIPMLSINARVDLLDEESGQMVCRVSYDPKISAVQSRLFTHAKPHLAALLRGLDESPVPGSSFARLTGVFPLNVGENAWRFNCRFPECEADAPIKIETFDGNSDLIACDSIIMEDHVVPLASHDELTERILTVSIKFDSTIDHAFVTFACGKNKRAFACGWPSDVRANFNHNTWLASGSCAGKDYALWSAAHRVSVDELAMQRRQLACLPNPLISIVVTVFNPPIAFLRECVESVLSQSYSNWQLVLVNASGDNRGVSRYLEGLGDCRVVVSAIENRDIATNTNAGIALCDGDYVAFLDHDDVLEPDALYRYVLALTNNPEIDLFYSDEDRLKDGMLHNPAFKAGPNLTKLYAYNYVTHFLMVSRYAINLTTRSTSEVSGAQDYDLTLKCFEVARSIHHEPRVLYHWREHEGSTAGGSNQKPYAHEAGRRALEGHFSRRGLAATVSDGQLPYTYSVSFTLPREAPLVSIIIPTKDHIDLLQRCVSSILTLSTYGNYEIIIVENNSQRPETFEQYKFLSADVRVRVVMWDVKTLQGDTPSENGFNYSSIINYGASHSRGEYLVLLNNDTEVIEPSWIEWMLGNFMRPEVGVVGAKLLFEDGLIQHAGMVANGNHDFAHINRNLPGDALGYAYSVGMPQEYSMVTGACQMTSRTLYERLGGYDEQLAVGFNDGDYCLRVKEEGKVVVYEPRAVLRHREFSSRGRESVDTRLAIRLLQEKSRIILQHPTFFASNDPAINPNLNQMSDWWELNDWNER